MGGWNYRIVKEKLTDEPWATESGDWYTIRSVYYNDDGSVFAFGTEAEGIESDTVDGLMQRLEWMKLALEKPVLVEGEIKCVDLEGDEDFIACEDLLDMVE